MGISDVTANKEFEEERERRNKAIAAHVDRGIECLHDAGRICMETYEKWNFQRTRSFYAMANYVRKARGIDSQLEAVSAYKSDAKFFAAGEQLNRAMVKIQEAELCWVAAVGAKNTATELKRKREKLNAPAPGPRGDLHIVR